MPTLSMRTRFKYYLSSALRIFFSLAFNIYFYDRIYLNNKLSLYKKKESKTAAFY
jgi:hypothetical protein